MKISKNQLSNLGLLVIIALFLFTPFRTNVSVLMNRLISFSPSTISESNRTILSNYNWNLKKLDNTNTSYNFNAAKGEVVLVNLWATWCPPCIAEMPDLQALYNEYGDKVTFLFVTQESKEKVQSFLDKNEYTIPVYKPLTKTPDELFSRSIPATYLIDKNGAIVIDKKGAANWDSNSVKEELERLLAE